MRLALVVFFGLVAGLGSFAVAQENAQRQSAVVTLFLPPNIASENVQINYFMIGPFGGYGNYVDAKRSRGSYDIPASVEGKPAEAVKIIAYLSGCEIVKLEITMQSQVESRTLACKTLGTVPLPGRILRIPAIQAPGLEVEVSYEADWDHEFFGIADGPVTTVHVATVTPDEAGQFQVELPDFFKQADLGKCSFRFLLREKASGNIVAMLKPENMPQFFGTLAIGRSYAPFVLFSADTSVSTQRSTDSGAVINKLDD